MHSLNRTSVDKRPHVPALAMAALLGMSGMAEAAPVTISYIFNGVGTAANIQTLTNPGLDPSITLPASLTDFSAWSMDVASGNNNQGVNPFTTGVDGAAMLDQNLASVISKAIGSTNFNGSGGNAFNFSFRVADGFQFTISSISFLQQRSGSNNPGPLTWTLKLAQGAQPSNVLGSGATSPTNLTLAGLDRASNQGLVDFGTDVSGLLSFKLAGSQATGSATANMRVDNFVIEGDLHPVPLPAALWLMGSALSGLVLRRRIGT